MKRNRVLLLGVGMLQSLYGATAVSFGQYMVWLNGLHSKLKENKKSKEYKQGLFETFICIEGANAYDMLNNVADTKWANFADGLYSTFDARTRRLVDYKYEDILNKLQSIEKEEPGSGREKSGAFVETEEFVKGAEAFFNDVKAQLETEGDVAVEKFLNYPYLRVPQAMRNAFRSLGTAIEKKVQKTYGPTSGYILAVREKVLTILSNSSESE